MRYGATAVPAAILAGVLAPSGATAQTDELGTEALVYLLEATAATDAQAEINRLAAEEGGDEVVRGIARALLADYTEHHATLSDLAQAHGIAPIAELDPVTEHRLEVLRSLDGPEFDATYVAGQAAALYGEMWVHRRAAEHVGEAAIRDFAMAAVSPTEASFEEALALALDREADLPDGLHPWDSTALVFGMNIDAAQVEMGELALERTEGDRVQGFAEFMIAEHRPSYERAAALAEQHGIPPVAEMGPVEARVFETLSQLPQPEFDEEYLNSQVIFHDHWYKRLEFTANNGRNEAVTAHAVQGRDAGKEHHDEVFAIVVDVVEQEPAHDH